MPTRGLRPSLVRTHSRSSSGASSKMVVNLQLTQKDPVQSKIDKARRTSHTHEPNPRVNVSRTGSTVHVQPREQVVTGPPPTRRTTKSPGPRGGGGRPKAGFTIATSTVGSEDEDEEWVSSESGAATPLDDASGDEGLDKKTPQESSSPATPVDLVGQQAKVQNPTAHLPGTTPRAEPAPPRPRVQTNGFTPTRLPHGYGAAPAARLSQLSETAQYPQQQWDPYRQPPIQARQQTAVDMAQTVQQHKYPPQLSHQPPTPSHIPEQTLPITSPRTPDAVPVASRARTLPPTPTSPRSDHYQTHRARPSSTRSFVADHALRPHPLIRGQSFGHGHLAPLQVSSDAAQAQLSSSPPPGRDASTSPTSIRTLHTPSPSLSSTIFRRPSTSSAHSAATLPVQPHTPIVERSRTISTISAASSSAALSSLAQLPTRASVAAAAQNTPLVVHFPPPQNPHSHSETVHALLPPPYVTPHFTILQWRSPICESHEKIARARDSQRQQQRRRQGAP